MRCPSLQFSGNCILLGSVFSKSYFLKASQEPKARANYIILYQIIFFQYQKSTLADYLQTRVSPPPLVKSTILGMAPSLAPPATIFELASFRLQRARGIESIVVRKLVNDSEFVLVATRFGIKKYCSLVFSMNACFSLYYTTYRF